MRYLALLLVPALAAAQPRTANPKIDITVERRDGPEWKAVPSGFVFKKNDHLRFRVRANFDGYLYVMSYGTSGQYSRLFPREETGTQNRIRGGVEYFVPSTGASFRMDGPPGYDIVYWMISPLDLGGGSSYVPLPPPPANPVPQNMHPRCDDSILRARSVCVDSSAGARNIAPDEKLPENLPKLHSRDVIISSQGQGTSVTSPERLEGPVMYKFLVAHE